MDVIITICRLLVLFIFLSSCGSRENETSQFQSSEEEYETILSGAELYYQNCAACHGNDGKLGASGAKNLQQSNLSNERIHDIIVKGKGAMPPMKSAIDSGQKLDSITEFIKNLRK